jgi:hypothetical protein
MTDLRSTILNSEDIDRKVIEVRQWGVKVEVRGMNGHQRANFVQTYADNDGKLDFGSLYPELILLGVYDPDTGERVFAEEDRDIVMDKSGAALETVATLVMQLSGLGEDAVDAVGKDGSSTSESSDDSTSS